MKLATLAAAAIAVLLATAAPAFAQPALTPLQQPAAAPQLAVTDPKDAGTATLLSAAGTAIPVALVLFSANTERLDPDTRNTITELGIAGIMFGPSAGHWYAHDYLTAGLGMRAAGTVLMIKGLEDAFACEDVCGNGAGVAPALLGAGLFVGGTIYDVATAGRAADGWNRDHQVRVMPSAVSSNGHTTMTFGLGGSF